MTLNNKYNLGFFPTPLHFLKNISGLYPDYNLFIKRDDNTGLASGGNKTRKLEYAIQQALDNNCDTVITAGAQQSNHCRQTAAACAVAGLECHLMLGGTEPDIYDGNLLLAQLLGAKLHFKGENRKGEDIEAQKIVLERQGRKCLVIPYGGSNLTGALGFVNAIGELKAQLIVQNITIDYVFFATGSGGTQAGLIMGLELFDLDAKLMSVSVDKVGIKGQSLEEVILPILQEGKKVLALNKTYQLDDIKIIRDYNEAGYGVITENERMAVKKLAQTEGIILDPVYTGRAFYGMLDYLEKKKIKPGSNVLFWHTGGLPANFYYAKELG